MIEYNNKWGIPLLILLFVIIIMIYNYKISLLDKMNSGKSLNTFEKIMILSR